jgi:hypothetical protein
MSAPPPNTPELKPNPNNPVSKELSLEDTIKDNVQKAIDKLILLLTANKN